MTVETDILERLKKFHAEIVADDGGESPQMAMTREAFEEIERLRSVLFTAYAVRLVKQTLDAANPVHLSEAKP